MAATHIILTVGLSEVPILVAAYRLCAVYWQRDGVLPCFSALCLQDTLDEAARVRHQLTKKLKQEPWWPDGGVLRWTAFGVPVSNPGAVHKAVDNLLRLQNSRRVHLHYTGGSRALSVHAMEAIATARDANGKLYEYEVSYLSSGENVLTWGSGTPPELADERPNWALRIAELSALNNFRPSSQFPNPQHLSEPLLPSEALLAAGEAMVPLFFSAENRKVYSNWLGASWDACWRSGSDDKGWAGWPVPPPADMRPQQNLSWVMLSPESEWRNITCALSACFGGETVWLATETGWDLRIGNLSDIHLSGLHQFLHYQCLELLAYRGLRNSLTELGYPNWAVYHSVRFARQGTPGVSRRDFELDVLAVLGYQLLAVSCSLSTDRHSLKRKAFEVLHRAKQIGGPGARTVLVCALPEYESKNLRHDVDEDTGPSEKNLEIWGADSLSCLTERFRAYLLNTLRVPTAAAQNFREAVQGHPS